MEKQDCEHIKIITQKREILQESSWVLEAALIKRIPYRNKKILNAAKGEECTLNSPWCNHNPETTVFCHSNEFYAGKGRGQKADDFFGFFGCSGCHDVVDRRLNVPQEWKQEQAWRITREIYRTQRRLFALDIIK